jgi:hypothetical protein
MSIYVAVLTEDDQPLSDIVVEAVSTTDLAVLTTATTNRQGEAVFTDLAERVFFLPRLRRTDKGKVVVQNVVPTLAVYTSITLWLAEDGGITQSDPGTSYTNLNFGSSTGSLTANTFVDFSRLTDVEARVIANASDNAASGTKGIRVARNSDGLQIGGVVEWTGTGFAVRVGSWAAVSLTADTEIKVQIKSGTATGDMALYRVELQLRAQFS